MKYNKEGMLGEFAKWTGWLNERCYEGLQRKGSSGTTSHIEYN